MTRHDSIQLRHKRIRKKVSGTAERPRLAVNFSGRHIRAQVIDDTKGVTLAAASTQEKAAKAGANVANAQSVGKLVADRAKKKSISKVVFDRGGFQYMGKVKALADAAREAGLEF
ncbi:MAG: 50S ribosomal protein L18 [Chthoniobacterales bacterium]|nr:50S ribosomal protein L18 [Chthoniobacterales bacterium]